MERQAETSETSAGCDGNKSDGEVKWISMLTEDDEERKHTGGKKAN